MYKFKINKNIGILLLSGTVLTFTGCSSNSIDKEVPNLVDEEIVKEAETITPPPENSSPILDDNKIVITDEKEFIRYLIKAKDKYHEIMDSETVNYVQDKAYNFSTKLGDFILLEGTIG